MNVIDLLVFSDIMIKENIVCSLQTQDTLEAGPVNGTEYFYLMN